MQEKRRHNRYPVIHEMDKPIQILLAGELVPGVLVDLSAGGMAVLAYKNVSLGTAINLLVVFG